VKLFLNFNSTLKALAFTLIYLLLAIAAINGKMILNVVTNPYTFMIKVKILSQIFISIFQSTPLTTLLPMIIVAILFGINTMLILKKTSSLRTQKNVKLSFGIGLLSLAASGCASCGFSLFSLAGLGGVLALLPYHGVEFSYIAIIMLSLSIRYNYKAVLKTCALPKKQPLNKAALALSEVEA
jgi:hypothetical protein